MRPGGGDIQMNVNRLDKIIKDKRERIDELKRSADPKAMRDRAESKIGFHRDFAAAISRPEGTNIIAEFKRASPSKGSINHEADPDHAAREYERGGAIAISVLTEEDHFGGSITDLKTIRESVILPVLRKDFILEEFQIFESAAVGADAVLLIAAILEREQISDLRALAAELGLSAVIEVHNRRELDVALEQGATIVGVNNRNLRTFEVSLDISRELILDIPKGVTMIAESGICSRREIDELRGLGYSAFLIGETLMRSEDPVEMLAQLGAKGSV